MSRVALVGISARQQACCSRPSAAGSSLRRHSAKGQSRHLTSVTERPLAGIKVVDFTRVLAGPYATQMLADWGADVIKVENPKSGDDTRSWLPPAAPLAPGAPRPNDLPESAYFLQANRNKRSLTLNVKHPEGQAIVHKLVKDADVFVENYIPAKLDKFDLGYDRLAEINPSLIYCSITGYGSTGPYAQAPGYDVVIEAEAGLMHITGENGGQPVKVGVAVTDLLTGHFAQSGILAALIKRGKTGKGSRVECSLFESQIASLANIASNYLIDSQEATRWGTSHPSIVPYQVFPTKDSYIMLSAGNDSQFAILCSPAVLDRAGWISDPRFQTNAKRVENRQEMIRLIEEVLSGGTTQEWCSRLTGKGLPFAPINNIAQTFAHPQAIARGVVEEVEHPRAGRIKLVGAPTSIDGAKLPIYRPPPWLGQHTTDVLGELGYDLDQIDDLRRRGIV